MSEKKKRTKITNALRESVINYVFDKGESVSEVARLLELNKRTVYGICTVFTKENRIERKKANGRKCTFDFGQERLICAFWKLNADATLKECQDYIKSNPNLFDEADVSLTTIDRILRKHKITTKQLTKIPLARNSVETIKKRCEYVTSLLDLESEDCYFIYVDEFGVNLHTRRSRGRSLIGQPAIIETPTSRGNNFSTCAGVSIDGVVYYRSQFRPFNHGSFLEFLDGLKAKLDLNLNNVLVMDNVALHKHSLVKQWFDQNELKYLYLPPYSPFLNPIEECFSKIHTSVCLQRAANTNSLIRSVEIAFKTVTSDDLRNWFKHSRAYHTMALRREKILKEANKDCPPFRVDDRPDEELDEENEEEDELLRQP